jgi:hypothetical protein
MSIRVQRALRNLIHGPYGRWIMLGLLIVILCVFTVTQDIEDWLRGAFGGDTAGSTSDVAGSFAVLPGDTTEVSYSGFEAARRRIGLARAFLERSGMDRVQDTDVWAHLVLLEAAKNEQIAVSVEDLREIIGRVVPDYIFNDPQQYRKWVQDNFQGASAPALEAAVLEYLTAFRVRQIYRESFLIGPPATRKAAIDQAAAQNVEYALGDYAALDAKRFLAEAEEELKSEADPDKKLREFFDKDPSVKLDNERFRHPRRFKIELLYSIHANVDTDEELARIEGLVTKTYPGPRSRRSTSRTGRPTSGPTAIAFSRRRARPGRSWPRRCRIPTIRPPPEPPPARASRARNRRGSRTNRLRRPRNRTNPWPRPRSRTSRPRRRARSPRSRPSRRSRPRRSLPTSASGSSTTAT